MPHSSRTKLGMREEITRLRRKADHLEELLGMPGEEPEQFAAYADDDNDYNLLDIFDLDILQEIQDAFSKAVGAASLITGPDGEPITRPSNFCRLCQDIIRKTEKGLANCKRSDVLLGRLGQDGPVMQPCLSCGLWDGAARISLGERHIATWLVGQVRDEDQDPEEMLAYAREIGADEDEFRAALAEVTVMSRRQFANVCRALFLVANQMSSLALQNVRLSRQMDLGRKIDEALKVQRRRFQTLVDKSPLGMSLVLPDGRWVYVNRTFTKLFGYGLEDVPDGKAWFRRAFPDPEYRRHVISKWVGDVKEFGLDHCKARDFNVTCADGSVKAVHIQPVTLASGERYLTFFDITERVRAERALAESEEKYAKAFQASPVWVVLSSLEDGRYIEVNEAFCRGAGYRREEVIGRTSLELGVWADPEDRRRIVEQVERHGSVSQMEVRRRTKSGEILDTLFSSELVTLGGRERLLSVTLDITERKRVLKDKQRLEAQLRQAQKMEAVGALAGGIAHDFNNILSAVIGYAELAMEKIRSDEDNQGELEQVLNAAERARDLVNRILTFSRKGEADLKPLDLNQEAARTAKLLERTIPKMVDIQLRLAPDLWKITGDSNQLEQVLMNLASNANDAMPEGGRLVIETSNAVLDKEYSRAHMDLPPGRYVLLRVSDTGQGMDPETLAMIFDPFFTTKEVGKGTGLGLSTVFGIVKSHKGHISCYSEPGCGAEFKIYLPARAESGGADAVSAEREENPRSGDETVLVVDDEKPLLDIARRILTKHGYKAVCASSGEEALEIYADRGREIDLVVLDVSMPGMGGRKCLEELTARDPSARVIIASGYSLNGSLREVVRSGASGFVGKPYRSGDLLRKIREVLDQPRQS